MIIPFSEIPSLFTNAFEYDFKQKYSHVHVLDPFLLYIPLAHKSHKIPQKKKNHVIKPKRRWSNTMIYHYYSSAQLSIVVSAYFLIFYIQQIHKYEKKINKNIFSRNEDITIEDGI